MSDVPRETRPLASRRTRERAIVTCGCGRQTDRARDGRCPRCAVRRSRGAELGAACACCGEDDRRLLCLRRLASHAEGAISTLCGSCAVLLGRRELTLDELRAERLGPAAGGAAAA
jgi:hypothetical protein